MPEGTIVQFQEPSLWRQHRNQILGVLALVALQTLLLVALGLRVRKRRLELALRESEERYRNVVESQTDLICRYLPDTTLTFVNDAYCRYFGRSREQLLGTRFIDLIAERDREKALAQVSSVLSNRTTVRYDHRLGLSICRSIIAAHGGRLSARNNRSRGMTFEFTIPASVPSVESRRSDDDPASTHARQAGIA